MSTIQNEQYLEDAQADFDGFLQKKEWKNAQAVIDNLKEQGFSVDTLSQRLLLIQREWEEQKDWADARNGFAVAEERAETPFEQKKRTLCPEVNCTDPTCQFMHD